MALHGAGPLEVGDIDLLMTRADAARLLEAQGVTPAPGERDGRFQSDLFGCWPSGRYAVEVMGGLHVRHGFDWLELVPRSRVGIAVGSELLHVPSVEELIAMCRLFGRPKDAERQRLLEAFQTPQG